MNPTQEPVEGKSAGIKTNANNHFRRGVYKVKKAGTKSPMIRLLDIAGSYRSWLVLAAVVSVLGAACTVFSSIYLGRGLDAAVSGDRLRFYRTVRIVAGIAVIEFPVSILRTYCAGRYAQYAMYDIREKTTKHIQKLPASCLDRHPSGDLLSRLNNDISLLQQFLQGSLAELIAQPITFLAAAAYLFVASFALSLASFTATPLFLILILLMSRPIEKYTVQQQEALAEVNVVSKDMIEGMEEAKAFQIEETLDRKCVGAVKKALGKSLKTVRIHEAIAPVNLLMQMLPILLIFAYGGYLVTAGRMTFGELISFINLSNFVLNPMAQFPSAIASYRTASAASSRIIEIWNEPVERESGQCFSADSDVRTPAICFEDVSFSYGEEGRKKDREVLQNQNFEIAPGQTIALAGPSGCGKSTVLKLIAGFYAPCSGNVRVFGGRTEDWNLEALRSHIAWVSQDTYLYPRSIYENIAYGKRDATEQEIIAAAKAADIHDFIESLPEGYRTLAGERGARLSGGQRQRIAIARALLKDAPILLLDEATSALDTESEREVQQALEVLMKGRTVLVVAHRLTTIRSASRILVMEHGHIVEEGTHEELMQTGSLYRKLYYKQYAEADSGRMQA